ncbi:MAG: Gfo/Idh/MocA family oxidoreductase [Sumerlaeia bacterium]
MTELAFATQAGTKRPTGAKPRLGFLGVGWIGRHRMECLMESGAVEGAAVSDLSVETASQALDLAPGAKVVESLDDMLALGLDGIVIATPNYLHAEQATRALESGCAVFCQKPLARTASETEAIIAAARRANRLLGVDLSYRHVESIRRIRDLAEAGRLGKIFAVDLVFHNAYGPDKDWFYDPEKAGGGCALDLGIHLVDLALWMLGSPGVRDCSSRLYAGGELLREAERVEDYCEAQLLLDGGETVRLATSWNLSAGRDAVIEIRFHGTEGGAAMTNVDGSFFDFRAEAYRGRNVEVLAEPPDAWGGRAAVAWAERLARDACYDPEIERMLPVMQALDAIYGRALGGAHQ